MKKYVIREVETLKTTAALYGDCWTCPWNCIGQAPGN